MKALSEEVVALWKNIRLGKVNAKRAFKWYVLCKCLEVKTMWRVEGGSISMIFCQMSSSFNRVGVLCECKMRKKIILNIRKT